MDSFLKYGAQNSKSSYKLCKLTDRDTELQHEECLTFSDYSDKGRISTQWVTADLCRKNVKKP